ncbi:MAG: diguanylate cyclase [candidate division WOR-3 bacterium]|nr:MAG: diguanylate cyclase [candidate division WOR-3 bacterium]
MKEIYRDDLTNCYNRRYMRYWIDNEIKRAKRFDTKFALMLVDVDDFRSINNKFGHLEGDRVLAKFGEFLRENVREVDSVVRYGGDEFFVLMPNSSAGGVLELGRRIIATLAEVEVRTHKIQCSIGFAVFPDNGAQADNLIDHADVLMYQAKREGKNRIGVRHTAVRRLRIPSPVTIGREDETNWCINQLKEFKTIFIAGTVGIGKTRFVMEIKDRLNTQIVARGNAYEALALVAYHPFKNMLRDMLNSDFSLVQQTFKRMAEIYQSELAKLLPVSGILRTVEVEELDKYRLYHAISEFLGKLSEAVYPGTTILFIDDLHWADRPSIELLDFLMRSTRNSLAIFGTYRIEEKKNSALSNYLGLWARERLYTQITLSPLSDVQTNQLLESVMGKVPPPVARLINKESGGNPFFIEEILKAYWHSKRLHWDGNEWVLAKGSAVSIPSTIEETIKRKYEKLDPETQAFLEIAAVFGQEFSPEIIALASKRNVGQILEELDELCRTGFLKNRTADTYFFSEDIVRQIVYKNITRSNLRSYHRSVGEAIETTFHSSISDYYEELVNHFTHARNAPKTLDYSKKAALKARDNYAHSLALQFYETALKYEDNIEQIFQINFALADIHISIGHYSRALDLLRKCLKINPHAYRIYEKLGNVHEKMGQYRRSLKYYEKGVKITKGSNAVYIFRAAIAWLYTRMGQYARAREECFDILKRKKYVNRQTLGDAYVILGVVLLRMGKFNSAEQYIKKSLRIRRSIGDKKNIAACFVDLGLNYQGKFNITMSERFFNRALSIYQEVGYQEGILITLNNLGVMYANYDLPKAEAYCLEALTKAKLIGAKRTIVLLHNNLGMISHNRLMSDQALDYFRHSLRLAKDISFYEGIIFAGISLSELYREKGKIKKGRRYLQTALDVAADINIKFLNIDCLMEEVEYYLRAGQKRKAAGLVKRMTAQLKMESNVLYRIYNLIYRARILAVLGENSRCQTLFRQAQTYLRGLPPNKISGEIFYLRGVAYKREDKSKDALKMFLEADKIFKVIGNLRYLDKIEQEIAGTRSE